MTQFNEDELARYNRQFLLKDIGGIGQQKLKRANICCVGTGGLGSPVLLYLVGAGVGNITIIDDDIVSLSNLHRQIAFSSDDIDALKVRSIADRLYALNPNVNININPTRLNERNATDLLARHDLIIDCTDGAIARKIINQTCVSQKIALLSGAIAQWEGHLFLYDPQKDSPCYECVFPDMPIDNENNCAELGVVGPLAGMMGSYMAIEAMKYVLNVGDHLDNKMMLVDVLFNQIRFIEIEKNINCTVCKKGL